MSRLLVTSRALEDRRVSLAFWVVGLVVYTALIVAVWPFIDDNEDFKDLAQSYPDALQAMFGGADAFALFTTPEGFLNTYLFSMILPLLLVGMAVAMGSALLAGDEEDGLLDLLLSNPLTRTAAVTQKALAIGLALVAMGVALCVVVLVLGRLVDLDVGVGALAAATLGALLYGLLHGLIALLAGSLRGAKGFALGVGWGLALLGYLINVVANLTDSLEPLRWLSPLYYATADDPIVNGVPPEFLALAGACAVIFGATIVAFRRHDLS